MGRALLSGTSELRGQGGSASSASSVDPFNQNNTHSHSASFGNNSNAVCDPHAIRRKHPERWATFIRAHFQSITAVSHTFGVDYNTAKHWWLGTGAAQGWAVEYAIKAIPTAAEWMAMQ